MRRRALLASAVLCGMGLLSSMLLLAAPVARKSAPMILRGSFGSGLPVMMTLSPTGNALSGEYFYEKSGSAYVPQALELVGKQDAAGNATLTETDDEGQITGSLTGRFGGKEDARRFEGIWSSQDGKRKLPFTMVEIHPDQGPDGARLILQSTESKGRSPRYTLSSQWPRMVGSDGKPDARMDSFNDLARSQARTFADSFRKLMKDYSEDGTLVGPDHSYTHETSYTVASLTPRTVSIAFTIYEEIGGEHPSTNTRTLNFDRRTGKPLRLADLFRSDFHYLSFLSKYCRPALHDDFKRSEGLKGVPYPEGIGPVEINFVNWTLVPQGLNIHFDRYQVAAYAEGDRDVILPWSLLKSHLRPDCPAAPLMGTP